MFVDEHVAQIGTSAGVRTIYPDALTHFDSVAAIRELLSVSETGGVTISPPREARKTLEIILGFMASQKEGNIRIDFPLDENMV